MLKKLGDKYTRFITPVKYEALRNAIVGVKGEDVSGIGVTLSNDKDSGRVKIVDTIEESPASAMGLKRDSLVAEVDGVRTDSAQTTAEEVAALVRGPTGTKVPAPSRLDGHPRADRRRMARLLVGGHGCLQRKPAPVPTAPVQIKVLERSVSHPLH